MVLLNDVVQVFALADLDRRCGLLIVGLDAGGTGSAAALR